MYKKFKRVSVIVLDSVGIGEAPDAEKFDDVGADTLGHIGESIGGLNVPNMEKIGLSNIRTENPIKGVAVQQNPIGYFTKMDEISAGKDSIDGHFEMMGLPVKKAPHVFPNGFPKELIDKVEKYSGRKIIFNKPASGTEIIKLLGEEQMKTGNLIVYTSGDSVFQIAAHEKVIPLEELYDICKYVRSITIEEPYHISRIIARPYIGDSAENFTRTSNRHDFSIEPTSSTVMDHLKDNGYETIAIGKINDIFSGHGITKGTHTVSNMDGMDNFIKTLDKEFTGFCFTNLVDFDAMYGHRRDPEGYGKAIEMFDKRLGEAMLKLKNDDLLIITADHGNDPTFKGTDHTRECVPLLVFSPCFNGGNKLPTCRTFSDLGATIADNFNVDHNEIGTSFLNELN